MRDDHVGWGKEPPRGCADKLIVWLAFFLMIAACCAWETL